MKFIIAAVFSILSIGLFIQCNPAGTENAKTINKLPVISPDYSQIVIPVNIAPLNFKVEVDAESYFVTISSKNGNYTQQSADGKFLINETRWKKLLAKNTGDTLFYQIFTKDKNSQWYAYKKYFQVVSTDSIDSYLAYRLINTGYVLWEKLGLYQRNLETFDQDPIIENTSLRSACLNCHSFAQQSPKNMMLHTRLYHGGTTIYHNGELKKVETKTQYTMSSGVYPSWHPSGKIIAFSVNKIGQQFHAIADRRITVSDAMSDLIIYNVEKNEVSTCPQLSTKWRENMPTWSPDGKYLYYISAKPREKDPAPVDAYEPYYLLRISYNVENNTWGTADTLITPEQINGSVTFPRISADGNFLVFTKAKNGYFTIHDKEADLYSLNLQTSEIKRLSINSDNTESYHSFSHSGKWLVFSSKRSTGLFTRPWFTHFNSDGSTTKPFILPQKDPEYYADYLLNYNVPEFITGKIEVSPIDLRDVITNDSEPVNFDPTVDVDALSGATAKVK